MKYLLDKSLGMKLTRVVNGCHASWHGFCRVESWWELAKNLDISEKL